MYCTHCGKEISDDAAFCPECGVATGRGQPNYGGQNYGQPNYGQPYVPAPTANRWLVTVAKVFIILAFVALGISLLAVLCLTLSSAAFLDQTAETNEDTAIFYMFLIYLIFIIIYGIVSIIFGAKALKCIKNKVKPSVAVCVCVLLFTNLIAGILLLCTKNEDYV